MYTHTYTIISENILLFQISAMIGGRRNMAECEQFPGLVYTIYMQNTYAEML
jgi:TATA-box binding protein (TBP) (component of TFIID and TFIIIB)